MAAITPLRPPQAQKRLLCAQQHRQHNAPVQVVVPRRIAAKAAARRMAALTGTRVGREVGYQVRLDSRVSAQTRVVVVTPGVLLKQLQEAWAPC